MLDRADRQSANRILSDGTSVSELVDRENREVDQRVLHDAEIFRLELEHIFAKAWIVLGHESEIPNSGDFVTRKMGEDPVIAVRKPDGGIEVMLNACTHRGTMLCRTDRGNSSVLRCIYHGWIFSLDGNFRGAPFQKDMFPDGCDTAKLSLRKARVSVFAGIIFANWDEDGPSLEEYLGDFAWYLNLVFNRTNAGFEVLGPPQRFMIPGNWKSASEQFAGDGYHAGQLHRSIAELFKLDPNNPEQLSLRDPKVTTKGGHGFICFSMIERMRRAGHVGVESLTPMERLSIMPPSGVNKELVPELPDKLSEDELRILSENPPSNGGLFPNVGIWSNATVLPDGSPSSFLSFRTFVPHGPDKFEFIMWALVARDAPEEFRDQLRLSASFGQGATGFIEGDDAEVWPAMSTVSKGFIGSQNKMRYWAKSEHNPPGDWPAGGSVHTEFSRDDNQWSWWSRYFDYLEGNV